MSYQRPANQAVGVGTTNKPKKKKPSSHSPSTRSIIDEASNGLGNIDPSQPLTMDQLKTAMRSAINTKYGSSQAALNTQVRDSQGMQTAIPGYYQDYLHTLQGLQGSQQQAYGDAAASTKVEGSNTGALGALGNLFSGSLASRGQNAYDASQAQIAQVPQLQLGASQVNQRRTDDLQKQLTQLNSEAGDYGNTYLLDALKNERDFMINQGTLEAAGVKAGAAEGGAEAAFQAKYGISRAEAADGITSDEAHTIHSYENTIHPPKKVQPKEHAPVDGVDYDVWKTMSPKQRQQAHHDWSVSGRNPSQSDEDQYGNTPKERRSNQNSWEKGLDAARAFGPSNPDLKGYLTTQAQVPSDLAGIIDYWAKHTAHIPQEMIDALHQLGIKVGQGHREASNLGHGHP